MALESKDRGVEPSIREGRRQLRELAYQLADNNPLRTLFQTLCGSETEDSTTLSLLLALGNRSAYTAPGIVLWKDRKNYTETAELDPVAFVSMIYGTRFHPIHGMTFAELLIADRSAYGALHNWRHRPPGNELPSDFGLLSKADAARAKREAASRDPLAIRIASTIVNAHVHAMKQRPAMILYCGLIGVLFAGLSCASA